MKYKFRILSFLLIALLCVSCTPKFSTLYSDDMSSTESTGAAEATDTTTVEVSTKVTEAQPFGTTTAETEPPFIDGSLNLGYALFKDTPAASDYITIQALDLGERAQDFIFWTMISRTEVIATLQQDKYKTESLGIYHLDTQTYEELAKIGDRAFFVQEANDSYIIAYSTPDNGVTTGLEVFDFAEKTLKPLEFPEEDESEIMQFCLMDETLYFSDKDLYSYDLKNGKTTLVSENLCFPMPYKDNLIAWRKGTEGKPDALCHLDGTLLQELPQKTGGISTSRGSDQIFVFAVTGIEDLKLSDTMLLNWGKNDPIISSYQTLSNLTSSSDFVSWSTYVYDKPCLYLVQEDVLIFFDNMPPQTSRFLSFEDTAVLVSTYQEDEQNYYFLVQKN